MTKFQILFLLLFSIGVNTLFAQSANYRSMEYDIHKYIVYLKVDPSISHIDVKAVLEIEFLADIETLYLDLQSESEIEKEIKGMKVDYIVDTKYQDTLLFEHKNNLLFVRSIRFKKGYNTDLLVVYSGSPENGLIFSNNKFGNPTLFADNWPNRAHHWLVSNDHPSDKAIWEIMVEAPKKYQVISNGKHYEKHNYNETHNRNIYTSKVEIPTKVMVFAVAEFAVDNVGSTHGVPVSSWVFPENKIEGFHDYSQAKEILSWFIEKIDTFPYSKLANVQSKTMFGGMENAGCIFYFENSVTGKRLHEDLIAHEIVHQWFGNSASELDWPHLWLSEGFATYLTDLYILDVHGKEAFIKRLVKERNKVIAFSKEYESPVVDHNQDLFSLLNPNSYEKGAWVLHMIKQQVGSDVFWKIIKAYYNKYKFSNATTTNFIEICEEVSGEKFQRFQADWLNSVGHPSLDIKQTVSGKSISFSITQLKEHIFEFPLEIRVSDGKKKSKIIVINIDQKVIQFDKELDFKVKKVTLDPNTNLLFEYQLN